MSIREIVVARALEKMLPAGDHRDRLAPEELLFVFVYGRSRPPVVEIRGRAIQLRTVPTAILSVVVLGRIVALRLSQPGQSLDSMETLFPLVRFRVITKKFVMFFRLTIHQPALAARREGIPRATSQLIPGRAVDVTVGQQIEIPSSVCSKKTTNNGTETLDTIPETDTESKKEKNTESK